jgi:hypothetical protein
MKIWWLNNCLRLEKNEQIKIISSNNSGSNIDTNIISYYRLLCTSTIAVGIWYTIRITYIKIKNNIQSWSWSDKHETCSDLTHTQSCMGYWLALQQNTTRKDRFYSLKQPKLCTKSHESNKHVLGV